MGERGRAVGREDEEAPLLSEAEAGYLVVLGVVVWEGDRVVEGLVGGQEGGPVEDRVVDLVVGQEAADEALDRAFLQASQEASGKEERLVGVQEVGLRVDRGAS